MAKRKTDRKGRMGSQQTSFDASKSKVKPNKDNLSATMLDHKNLANTTDSHVHVDIIHIEEQPRLKIFNEQGEQVQDDNSEQPMSKPDSKVEQTLSTAPQNGTQDTVSIQHQLSSNDSASSFSVESSSKETNVHASDKLQPVVDQDKVLTSQQKDTLSNAAQPQVISLNNAEQAQVASLNQAEQTATSKLNTAYSAQESNAKDSSSMSHEVDHNNQNSEQNVKSAETQTEQTAQASSNQNNTLAQQQSTQNKSQDLKESTDATKATHEEAQVPQATATNDAAQASKDNLAHAKSTDLADKSSSLNKTTAQAKDDNLSKVAQEDASASTINAESSAQKATVEKYNHDLQASDFNKSDSSTIVDAQAPAKDSTTQAKDTAQAQDLAQAKNSTQAQGSVEQSSTSQDASSSKAPQANASQSADSDKAVSDNQVATNITASDADNESKAKAPSMHDDIASIMANKDPDEEFDFSSMVAEGCLIMNDAVLSNDGQTAIIGLETLNKPQKTKANTHVIIGANNEQIISYTSDEEDKPDIPTPPRDPATYAAVLAAQKARKAEENRLAAEKAKKKKDEEDNKRILNQTSKSIDDFDFGHDRSLPQIDEPIIKNEIPKQPASSSGMGNGFVSNILDNKDPYAGRENQPHIEFGSRVSDFDDTPLSQAEIARARLRQSLAKDYQDEERERELLIKRGIANQERARQEKERIEREQMLAEQERRRQEQQEQERIRQEQELQEQELQEQERLRQEQEQEQEQQEQSLQNLAQESYTSLQQNTQSQDNYASYNDPSEYEGIAAPVTEDTPHYPQYDTSGIPAMMPEDLHKSEEDDAPTYMVGPSRRQQPQVPDHTAMFVQGDEDEPSPYVCGVNARRLSDSDLRKRQQQQHQQQSNFGNTNNLNQRPYANAGQNSYQNASLGQNSYTQPQEQDPYYGTYAEQNASTNMSGGDLRLQPGFGSNLSNNGLVDTASMRDLSYSNLYINEQTDENASNEDQSEEQLYWSPGQSTAEFQAVRANQQRRAQQSAMLASQEKMSNDFQDIIPQGQALEPENYEEERQGPMPTGMGDGVLSSTNSPEVQTLSAAAGIEGSNKPQNTGPVYMVGPSHPVNRMQDDDDDEGPVYAVGPQRINAKVEAKLQAERMKINSRIASNTSLGQMQQQMSLQNDESEAYANDLALAAREVAAPQSDVIMRGRMMAAQVLQNAQNDAVISTSSEGEHNNAGFENNNQNESFEFYHDAEPMTYADEPLSTERPDRQEEILLSGIEDPNNKFKGYDNAVVFEAQGTNQEQDLNLAVDMHKDPYMTNVNEEKEHIGLGMTVALYIRQLIASLFSHTTLSVIMPRTARKLGPCYPSSMAIPFLLVGFISALLGNKLCHSIVQNVAASPTLNNESYSQYHTVNNGSGLTVLIFLFLTGLASFRGIYRFFAYINRRRHDVILMAASVCIPIICFFWLTNNLFIATQTQNSYIGSVLAFSFAAMLSAAAASTLSWNVQQDPIDSCGTMTTRGLLLVVVMCFMAAFGLLHYIVGLSVLGVTFIMRLVFGYIIVKNGGTSHRSYVNGLQMLTFFAILLDMALLKFNGYELLSTSTLELVQSLGFKV